MMVVVAAATVTLEDGIDRNSFMEIISLGLNHLSNKFYYGFRSSKKNVTYMYFNGRG
jgi:hypothetical protein